MRPGRCARGSWPICCWSMAIRWRTCGLLQQKERLVAILKGGEAYKFDRSALERRRMHAAE